MRTDTRSQPADVSRLSRLATDAAPLLAWYGWYADPGRPPLQPHDIGDLIDALEPLRPYAAVPGAVGAAVEVVLAGGLGYTSDQHLEALDTLERAVHPHANGPPPWRDHPRLNTFVTLAACTDSPEPAEDATPAPTRGFNGNEQPQRPSA